MNTSPPGPAVITPPSRSASLATFLVFLIAAWCYHWLVDPSGKIPAVQVYGDDHYNLLLSGFMKGQLSLDLAPDPSLASLSNPYDPKVRGLAGLHDGVYYEGRYYLYFGVVPVLLFNLPVHALTGQFLTEPYVVLFGAWVGLAASLLLWRRMWPNIDLWSEHVVYGCGLVALAGANLLPVVLRRPAVWEIPIVCAFACFMWALYFTWRACVRPSRWLSVSIAAASTCVGLAMGSRPIYLAGAVVLLAPLFCSARTLGPHYWRRFAWWRLVSAAVIPVTLIGIALLAYNEARFNNPFEFGTTYQLAGGDNSQDAVLFSPAFIPYHLRMYLLSVPSLVPYFPFLSVSTFPEVPAWHMGIENPHGLLLATPWIVFVVAIPFLLARAPRSNETWWIATTGLGIALVGATVCAFSGAADRYMLDFTPGLMLLAAWSAQQLVIRCRSLGTRRMTAVTACVLAAWSTTFNVFGAFQRNRLLEINNPEVYSSLATFFNRGAAVIDRLLGTTYGPLEIELEFPHKVDGQIEPLVITGRKFMADYIYVHYLDAGLVRFGFEHTNYGGGVGPAMRFQPGSPQRVTVHLGSLYPPESHPAVSELPASVAALRKRMVSVDLNGRNALFLDAESYDPNSREPSIGVSGPERPAFPEPFSGRILATRTLTPPDHSPLESKFGWLRVHVRVKPTPGEEDNVLAEIESAGAKDTFVLRIADQQSIKIDYRTPDGVGHESERKVVDLNEPIELVLGSPLLTGRADNPIEVWVNGQIIMRFDGPSKATSAAPEIRLGGRKAFESGSASSTAITVIAGERIDAPP